MLEFTLNPRLAQDSFGVGDMALCRVLMMNDARYYWFVLVPRVADARDPVDLTAADYRQLWEESRRLSNAMRGAFSPFKLNVASLGNQVAQLHVHHVARFRDDAAWPAPIWGVGEGQAMDQAEAGARIGRLRAQLPAACWI